MQHIDYKWLGSGATIALFASNEEFNNALNKASMLGKRYEARHVLLFRKHPEHSLYQNVSAQGRQEHGM